MFNYFYISVFACVSFFASVHISISLVCRYVLPVASVFSAFVMYLVWLFFSKTIRVIHCFYPLTNPWKREENLPAFFL